MDKPIKFKPFVARSKCCESLLLLMRPRFYVSCPCGKTSVDAGNGYYHRLNVHEGVEMPTFYYQKKKGSLVMIPKKKKK